jgi:hypothetical protein
VNVARSLAGLSLLLALAAAGCRGGLVDGVKAGDTARVQVQLDRGANPNVKDKRG